MIPEPWWHSQESHCPCTGLGFRSSDSQGTWEFCPSSGWAAGLGWMWGRWDAHNTKFKEVLAHSHNCASARSSHFAPRALHLPHVRAAAAGLIQEAGANPSPSTLLSRTGVTCLLKHRGEQRLINFHNQTGGCGHSHGLLAVAGHWERGGRCDWLNWI